MLPDVDTTEDRSVAEKQAAFNTARDGAHMFRGAFLDRYARLERSLGQVLIHASEMPEYAKMRGKLPHLFGQKIAALRKIVESDGPLKAPLAKMAARLDSVAHYDETRSFMSHAVVETAITEHGETVYIFRMVRTVNGRSEHATMTIFRDEAKEIASRLGRAVNEAVQVLDNVGKKRTGHAAPQATVTPVPP